MFLGRFAVWIVFGIDAFPQIAFYGAENQVFRTGHRVDDETVIALDALDEALVATTVGKEAIRTGLLARCIRYAHLTDVAHFLFYIRNILIYFVIAIN